jgi:hypothetical protein
LLLPNCTTLFPLLSFACRKFYASTFFACAKKVTKKAQPILMLWQLSVEQFLGQNRR